MEGGIRQDGVNRSRLDGLETGAELLNDVGIMPVKTSKEKHYQEKRRDDDLAS